MTKKTDAANVPAVTTASAALPVALAEERGMVAGVTFKIKKDVTLPTLKQDDGQTVLVLFLEPIRTEQKSEAQIEAGEGAEINVVNVLELSTRRKFAYVVNAVTKSELDSAYPENGYVGRQFAIAKVGKVAGKRYKQMMVSEIEVEGHDAETGEVQAAAE